MENTLTIILPDAVFERLQAEAIKTERSVSQLAADAVIAVYGPAPLALKPAVHPRRAEMLAEVQVYEELHPQLVQDHLGQYVAITGGAVVDHDGNLDELARRIRRVYPGKIVLMRQVRAELPKPLEMRSPRLVRQPYHV